MDTLDLPKMGTSTYTNAADNDISCEVHTDSSGCPVIL